jgi:hypothetical protein
MTEEDRAESTELTPEEVEEATGEELPDRAAMSLVDANVAIPIDAAIAADVLADESVADAEAVQDPEIGEATSAEDVNEERG